MVAQAPFFIVGAGRSGTTLLRLILAGHSRLHIPPETWFLRPLVRDFPLTGASDATAGRTRDRDDGSGTSAGPTWTWPRMNCGVRLPRCRSRRCVDLIDLVYRHLLEASGKQRLGDKTPHYFAIVPELATLYPGAKFIYLVRDGRDVAISWIDAGWQRYYEPGLRVAGGDGGTAPRSCGISGRMS